MKKPNSIPVHLTQAALLLLSAAFYLTKPAHDSRIHQLLYITIVLSTAGAAWFLLRQYIKQLHKRTRNISQELFVASSQISAVSEEINLTINESAITSAELFTNTAEMAQLTTKLHENISSVYERISDVLLLCDEIKNAGTELEHAGRYSEAAVQRALSDSKEIIHSVTAIKSSSRHTEEYMRKLIGTTDEIVNILTLIESISRKMHLVTLNATIESARAGETGKAFAVVVDEMRSLSVATKDAVETVNHLLHTIGGEVSGVYHVVCENIKNVDLGLQKFMSFSENLTLISSSYTKVMDSAACLYRISEEEITAVQDASEKISEAEECIRLTAGNVSKVYHSSFSQKQGFENISGMGGRLHEAAETLSSLVDSSSFNVEGLSKETLTDISNTCFEMMQKELVSHPKIADKVLEAHQPLLSSFLNRYEMVEAVWTNGSKGRFICSIPEAGIANASAREWFQHSIGGERYTSAVYISAITKNPCITLSAPFFSESGDIIGVIGLDINLKVLQEKL